MALIYSNLVCLNMFPSFADIIQEMTMATQEPDPTLPLVTQEHVEVPRGSGEQEDGMSTPSPVSADVGATELSRRWESLATPASTAVVPLSLEVSSSMEGQYTNVGSVFGEGMWTFSVNYQDE